MSGARHVDEPARIVHGHERRVVVLFGAGDLEQAPDVASHSRSSRRCSCIA